MTSSADEAAFLPRGTVLLEVESGLRAEVFGDVLEGGGYYLMRLVDPPATARPEEREFRLQPGHVGGLYVVAPAMDGASAKEPEA